ncbi:hypothetical protein [Haloglycomyces albus]|uniref:hypothetical protein n=1 Tax=Haloglycomyces albus TaxID=526067 RepID=UPI0004BBB4BA|nr:hypothetical protein [Haloglycomyces albus]
MEQLIVIEHDGGLDQISAIGQHIRRQLFKRNLEEARIRNVLEVKTNHMISDAGGRKREIRSLFAEAPGRAWTRLPQGEGERGPREYDWAWGLLPGQSDVHDGYERSVLARRSPNDPDDIAYYLCFAPIGTTKSKLMSIAVARWGIESCFEEAKGQCGLDDYQVRQWNS